MNPYKLLLYLFLALLYSSASSQNLHLTGEVVDRFQNRPIPYATIGIKGKGLGTVADENGRYNFSVSASAVSDQEQVIISCIGYKNVETTIAALKQGHQRISLAPAQVSLGEVNYSPGQQLQVAQHA